MTEKTIRWGIVGTGHAKEFARGLSALPEARLVAVTSRYKDRAEAFAREFGIQHCHTDVAALASNPEVDVIYVGSSPGNHAAHALTCLQNGKPVLVEKPFTITAAGARAVFTLSRERGLFCMEAMWSRFLPATRQVSSWLEEGRIGEVRQVIADFGFRTEWNPRGRHFDPEQCGGCLLDVGVYSLAFADMALGGVPEGIVAQATLCETGVDEQTAMILKYSSGALAVLSCANRTQTPHRGCIIGTKGRIEVNGFVWAHGATLICDGHEPLVVEPKIPLPSYSYQAAETMRCMRAGLTESPHLRSAEILQRMHNMDEIRSQTAVRYPKHKPLHSLTTP
ncbi:MAG: Gfo/Idh/MocA family oxidoreductase [Luteolibacter sp.]